MEHKGRLTLSLTCRAQNVDRIDGRFHGKVEALVGGFVMTKEEVRSEYERRFFMPSHIKWDEDTLRYISEYKQWEKMATRFTNDFEYFWLGFDFANSSNKRIS